MKYLLMADRYQLMKEKVRPALEAGKIVISDRSFISTLVYQCENDYEVAATAFDHRFSLLPDLLILFDVEPPIAWERITNRRIARGLHEKLDLLEIHRDRYLNVCEQLFPNQLRIVDANKTISEIAGSCWAHIQMLIS
jgi:dTMP kinase